MSRRCCCAGSTRSAPVDAVYLDLHGAMVAEHVDDGEGEILRRVRKAVGPRVPIVASLDLHANVTQAMIDGAEALIAYRTYPHVDMAETGGPGAGAARADPGEGRGAGQGLAPAPVPDPADRPVHDDRAGQGALCAHGRAGGSATA